MVPSDMHERLSTTVASRLNSEIVRVKYGRDNPEAYARAPDALGNESASHHIGRSKHARSARVTVQARVLKVRS